MSTGRPVLLFPHIAKTAGVTLVTLLENAFTGYTFRAYFQENNSGTGQINLDYIAKKFNELPVDLKDGTEFIASHMSFGLHKKLPFECKYITLVRDPVERIISAYNYVTEQGWLGPEYSFDDFIDMDFLGSCDHMTRVINGDPALDSMNSVALRTHARAVNDADYDVAIRNIEDHFLACIPIAQFEMGLISFFVREKLRPAGLLFARKNETKVNRISIKDVSDSTVERIAALNAYDIRLYKYICDRFEKTYEQHKWAFDLLKFEMHGFQQVYRAIENMEHEILSHQENSDARNFVNDSEIARSEIRILTNKFVKFPDI